MTAVVYLDEEECLGIDAFVNELELLCATGKQAGRVDQAQLLELLPKLAATILKAADNKSMLKSMQKRCEPICTDLISAGMCSTVRRLVCVCLSRFYMHGDMLSIYARVNTLQSTLSGKEGKTINDGVRVCMLEVLAYLSLHHGRYLASAAPESMAIASKSLAKGSVVVRVASLHLAAAAVEGMNSGDRAALAVQGEAWNLFLKASRERTCAETRAAGTQLLSAVARAGGAALWRDGGFYWEEALRVCTGGLGDPARGVRDGYAMALCDLAVCVRMDGLTAAIKEAQRPAIKSALERFKADNGAAACRTALHQPLVDAALHNRAAVCASLAQAWCSYIGFAAAHSAGNANVLVDLAVQVVSLCDSASRSLAEAKAQGVVVDAALGGALAGGELPHLQACVLYILRAAVVENLNEAGQRLLLQRLVALLQRPTCPVPTTVVALEGTAILLDVLGEISDESGAAEVENAVMNQIGSSSTPARQLASQAAAALAAAQPASAAALLGSLLDKLQAAAMLLGGVRPVGSGAPPHVLAAYDTLLGKTQPMLMAVAHGAALAAASVLMVAMQLPLSVPSALPRQAYDIAVRLIMEPHSDTAASRALEREAGYIVLGALISCWGARTLSLSATLPAAVGAAGAHGADEALAEVLNCLALALGETAHKELDESVYTHSGGDSELAMELWWRSVALQALRTYMTCVLNSGLVHDTAQQVIQIADLLAPVLSMVDTQVCMQDPRKAKGGPAGLLAACSATFQLRLLECIQLLDLTRLQPASQSILLKMCSKPVRAAGMAAAGVGAGVAAVEAPPAAIAASVGYNAGVSAALHRTALHYCLAKEDAMLGPWPAGRFTAEDELHDFAGERGAPHNQPWEAPLLTALFRHLDPSATDSTSSTGGAGGSSGAAESGIRTTLSTDRARGALYPQPIGLAPGLLAAQAAVLGRLLCVQSQGVQLQILEDMVNAASAGKSRRPEPGDRDAANRKHAAGTLVAVAALSGLVPLMRQVARTAADPANKLPDKVLQLANALMDGGGASEPGLARAGAQLLAVSACIGTDTWAVKVVHAIVDEISRSVAEGRDPERRAALCLALGCIHRSKGGLALQAVVPSSVGALLAAVKRPVGQAALWALHALSLCAASAGGAYMPFVKVTLQLCQDLLVSVEVSGYDPPGLRPACARLANCMVGVLGPEFTLGSANYRMAKSLTSDMVHAGVLAAEDPQAMAALMATSKPGGVGVGSGTSNGGSGAGAAGPELLAAPRAIGIEALACELQAVLFAQQAILFAPRAVQPQKHVPMLQATLLSPRPALRKAAAATLFHLAKRDPQLLLPAQIEGALFAALDGETNASIAGLLREAIKILMAEGTRTMPSYWLACLSEVVFSSAGASGGNAGAAGGTDGHAGAAGNGNAGAPRRDEEEDDDDDVTAGAGGGSRSGRAPGGDFSQAKSSTAAVPAGAMAVNGTAGSGSIGSTMQAVLATVALRLRTRLFAADLLLRMVRMADEEAQGTPETSGDKLVDHLQELVDVGFKLSTGSTEALRPAGVQLLDAILHTFADVEDPLLPGARLLEQYQAQLVSALRASLAPTAAPQLAVAGGRLATTFLESGLVSGDGQVMSRLMDLLTGPLAAWGTQPYAGMYAEWVDVQQRVALLRAHAHCATLSGSAGDDLTASIVAKAHKPYKPLLASLWTALLQDHAIVSTQHPIVLQAYRSALLLAAAPSAGPLTPSATQGSPHSQAVTPRMSGDGRGPLGPGAGQEQLGIMSSDMVEAVRGVYASACPVVLEAVTSHFPSASEVHASRSASAAVGPAATSLWSRYTTLLDVGVMLVLDSSKALAVQVAALTNSAGGTSGGSPQGLGPQVARLLACTQGLRKLLDAEFVAAGLAAATVVAGVLRVLTGVVQAVLLPLAWLASRHGNLTDGSASETAAGGHLASLTTAVSDLIKELAQGVSAGQLAIDAATVAANGGGAPSAASSSGTTVGLAPALLEAILATSSVTAPFSVLAPPPVAPAKQPRALGSPQGAQTGPGGRTGHQSVNRTSNGGGEQKESGPLEAVRYLPTSLSLPASQQGALDAAAVSLLVAATLLLRKAPTSSLRDALPALLQLIDRLLHTAPPGMQLQAAHRFMGTLLQSVATTAERLPQDTTSPATPTPTASPSKSEAVSASSRLDLPSGSDLMTSYWLLLAELAQHVQAQVTGLRKCMSASSASHAEQQGLCSEAQTARCGAIITALVSATWHLRGSTTSAVLPATSPPELPAIITRLIWQVVTATLDLSTATFDVTANGGHIVGGEGNGVAASQGELRDSALLALARLRRSALEAVRSAVQDGAGAVQGSPQAVWCEEMVLALAPRTISTTHALLTHPAVVLGSKPQHPATLGDTDQDDDWVTASAEQKTISATVVGEEVAQGICEGVKVLVAAASLAATKGAEQAQVVCGSLLSLMVEAAAPEPASAALLGPAPRDLAIKLLTTLPASPLGTQFKSAVGALPAGSKTRLQAALLQASATTTAAAAASSPADSHSASIGTSVAKPTIQLKTTF